jgi:hypothetical protein
MDSCVYDLVRNNMTVNERESISNVSLWHKLMLRNSTCLAVQHLPLIMLFYLLHSSIPSKTHLISDPLYLRNAWSNMNVKYIPDTLITWRKTTFNKSINLSLLTKHYQGQCWTARQVLFLNISLCQSEKLQTPHHSGILPPDGET